MSEYHVRAVFDQFPWLRRYFLKMDSFADARVERAGIGLLDVEEGLIPVFEGYVWSRFFFFDCEGNLLRSPRPFWRRLVSKVSIEKALHSLGAEAMDCKYIVILQGQRMTMYRESRNSPIHQLPFEKRKKKTEEAKQRLRAMT